MTSTSAASGGHHHDDERPRLGELLVALGELTQEQLVDALARQREQGVPLGRLLVEEGFVHPATVAMALADQHGGLLKTEYGFATGHDTPPPPVRRIEPVEEPEPEPAPLRLAVPPPDEGALVALREELRTRLAAQTALEAELAAEREARGALEAQLAAAREALAAERDARAGVEAELAAARAVPERYPPSEHGIFFRTASGYRFATRVGPAPEVASTTEVDGERYQVVRVGPSPLPSSPAACAYLEFVGRDEPEGGQTVPPDDQNGSAARPSGNSEAE